MRALFRLPAQTLASRAGARFSSTEVHSVKATEYVRHRTELPANGVYPFVSEETFVAPSATVVGDVKIGVKSSVWYNAVVRGDMNQIRIGNRVSLGERSSVLTVQTLAQSEDEVAFPAAVKIGHDTVVKAGATLVSCTVGNGVIIGENATILEGALVEEGAEVAPNSVVPPGRRVPKGELWAGNPVEHAGKASAQAQSQAAAEVVAAATHAEEFLPTNTAFWRA